MALVFSIKEQASIELEYLDVDGNVAPIDGIPSWTIVFGDVTLVPSEDGLSAKIKSNGVPTTFMVLAKGDADLDSDEERFLEATILGVVEAVEAVSVGFKATVEPLS